MHRTRRLGAGLFLAGVAPLLAGCGSGSVTTPEEPAADAYDGPMHVRRDTDDEASVEARAGAAALALQCSGEPTNGGGGDYDSGLESTQRSPERALDDWLEQEGYGIPEDGYVIEREDGDRALLSYDVDGDTKVAVIVRDGIRDFDGDRGWGVESWATCDESEWPPEVSDALGTGVWEKDGRRVPTTTVRSYQGAEHCDWQDITFLELGPERDAESFVRDVDGELRDLLRSSYDATSALPDDATDTGFERDGRRLWLARDRSAAYLVALDDPGDVERWPGARERIGCA